MSSRGVGGMVPGAPPPGGALNPMDDIAPPSEWTPPCGGTYPRVCCNIGAPGAAYIAVPPEGNNPDDGATGSIPTLGTVCDTFCEECDIMPFDICTGDVCPGCIIPWLKGSKCLCDESDIDCQCCTFGPPGQRK